MDTTTKQKESNLTTSQMCDLLGVTKGQLRRLVKEKKIPKPKQTNKGPRYELNDERRIAAGIRPIGGMFPAIWTLPILVGGEK